MNSREAIAKLNVLRSYDTEKEKSEEYKKCINAILPDIEVLEILIKKKVNILDLIGCLNVHIYNSIIPFSSGQLTEEEFIKIRKYLDSK